MIVHVNSIADSVLLISKLQIIPDCLSKSSGIRKIHLFGGMGKNNLSKTLIKLSCGNTL